MELSEAFARTSINGLIEIKSLADKLNPTIVVNCLAATGIATVRKCKLSMGAMNWVVIGLQNTSLTGEKGI